MTEHNDLKDDVVDVVNEKHTNEINNMSISNSNSNSNSNSSSSSNSNRSNDNNKKLKTTVLINQSLWLRFKELIYKKYGYDTDLQSIDHETEFEQVVLVGLNHSLGAIEASSTTSLLFDGKKPRRDVLINLAKIANCFQNCDTSTFRRNEIIQIVRSVLGPVDRRTETKYRLCVELHSIKNTHQGNFDVDSFCNLIPQEYLNGDQE